MPHEPKARRPRRNIGSTGETVVPADDIERALEFARDAGGTVLIEPQDDGDRRAGLVFITTDRELARKVQPWIEQQLGREGT